MKLKYYLRGLGIGIVVTAILLSVSLHSKTKPMSDEEVKKRAIELGMEDKYDTAVLTDSVSINEVAMNEESKEDESVAKEKNVDENAKISAGENADQNAENNADQDDENSAEKNADNNVDNNADENTDNNAEVKTEEVNPKAEEALKKADEAVDASQKAADDAVEKAKDLANHTEDAAKDIEKAADDITKKADDLTKKVDNTEKTTGDIEKQIDQANQKADDVAQKSNDLTEIKTDDDAKPQKEENTSKPSDMEKSTDSTKTAMKELKITVAGGDGSMTVAKKLKEIGIIDDAVAFDNFLCQNGYDRKICTGVHIFKATDSKEEIAKNLTRKTN